MLKFLMYAGLAFLGQIAILVAVVTIMHAFDIKDTGGWVEWPIIYIYLWPLFILPSHGGSHGGELFLSPFTAALYSLVFGIIMVVWRKSSRKER